MERYQDVAYLRDGEEPRRWAFASLAERSVSGQPPPLLADGSFYCASQVGHHSCAASHTASHTPCHAAFHTAILTSPFPPGASPSSSPRAHPVPAALARAAALPRAPLHLAKPLQPPLAGRAAAQGVVV